MKVSRDGAVFFIGVFFIALAANSLGILFKSLFWILTSGLAVLVVLETIKGFCKERTKEVISKTQEFVAGVDELSLNNFNTKLLNEVTAVWQSIPEVGGVKAKELLFARQIRAIDHDVKELPHSMNSIIAQKALFEIHKKQKSLKFHKLGPKPHASAAEILRPLLEPERFEFKTFCEAC